MQLNLGCGPDYRPGWFNVDADHAVRADLHARITDYPTLERAIGNQHVELIYMKHVLEHLPIAEVSPHLAWCHRMLGAQGYLVIDGPDLRAMCAHLAAKATWTWDDVRMIYGGQGTVWDHHQAGWGPEFLAALCREVGFSAMRYQQVGLCFVLEARR